MDPVRHRCQSGSFALAQTPGNPPRVYVVGLDGSGSEITKFTKTPNINIFAKLPHSKLSFTAKVPPL